MGDRPDDERDEDTRSPERRPENSDTREPPGDTLSPSMIFGLLADERQRFALYYLQEHDGQGTLEDIATHVAAWENNTTVELTTTEMKNRVYAGFYHADLPKLSDYNVIDYDVESGHVRLTGEIDELETYLEFAKEAETDDYREFAEQLAIQTSEGRREQQR